MSYPIFVLEGPDGSGKSTLARSLAAKTGGKILHCTYRFKQSMYQYHLAMFRKAVKIAADRPVVMDRWWPSEIVYGNSYRSGMSYTPEQLDVLVQLGRDYNVSYTFCLPFRFEEYWGFYKARYKPEEEMYSLDEPRVNLVWRGYRELAVDYYRLLSRDTTQYYNVVLDQWRGDSFTDYILARAKNRVRLLTEDERSLMNKMNKEWKHVGLIAGADLLNREESSVRSLVDEYSEDHVDRRPGGQHHRNPQQLSLI